MKNSKRNKKVYTNETSHLTKKGKRIENSLDLFHFTLIFFGNKQIRSSLEWMEKIIELCR